jgi:hypothetical protein
VEFELRILRQGFKYHSFHEFFMEPAVLCGVSAGIDTVRGCMPSIQNDLVGWYASLDSHAEGESRLVLIE